jgi:hypothetical protein
MPGGSFFSYNNQPSPARVFIRIVNGDGLSRGWSEPKTFSINLATRFFPAF